MVYCKLLELGYDVQLPVVGTIIKSNKDGLEEIQYNWFQAKDFWVVVF